MYRFVLLQMKIRIRGIRSIVRGLDGLIDYSVKGRGPKRVADTFKRNLMKEISHLKSYTSPKHNTPTPLASMAHGPQRRKHGVYEVWMEGTGQGQAKNLPLIVEEGTQPHPQPEHPWYSKTGHPGSTGRFFWRKATQKTENRFDIVVQDEANELIKQY